VGCVEGINKIMVCSRCIWAGVDSAGGRKISNPASGAYHPGARAGRFVTRM
jgi:hypothetical protein